MQFTGQRFALASRHLDEALDVAQAQPGLRGDLLAHGRDCHAAVGAVHELHLEQALQLLDRVAERRLRHEASLGGAAEMLGLGQGDEVTQLLDCR